MKHAKIIYTVLLVSLALNFFIAGAVFVKMNGPGRGQPIRGAEQFNIEEARLALTPEYRPVVDEILLDFKDTELPRFRRMFELRREIEEILTADEFDAKAFKALSGRVQKSGDTMRVTLQTLTIEIAMALPDAERKRYFKAGMEQSREGRDRPPRRRP